MLAGKQFAESVRFFVVGFFAFFFFFSPTPNSGFTGGGVQVCVCLQRERGLARIPGNFGVCWWVCSPSCFPARSVTHGVLCSDIRFLKCHLFFPFLKSLIFFSFCTVKSTGTSKHHLFLPMAVALLFCFFWVFLNPKRSHHHHVCLYTFFFPCGNTR